MQATLPSKPEQNTSVPMMRGVWVAYAVVSWCYFCVAIAGYWAFGNSVEDNVIFSIGHPRWMVAMADIFVTIHVIGSYQVLMPPRLSVMLVRSILLLLAAMHTIGKGIAFSNCIKLCYHVSKPCTLNCSLFIRWMATAL